MEIVGIKYFNKDKMYYTKKTINCNINDNVIANENGVQDIARVYVIKKLSEEDIILDNINIVRLATENDTSKYEFNNSKSLEIVNIVNNIINNLNLEMNVLHAYYSLNRDKLVVTYFSEGRVDFRELLKELSLIFKAKIELYQVSEREYSRNIGGLGPCGKPLCCSTFLNDFHQVSMKMVKDQNLIFNLSKVTGNCGKLLCCLKYENEFYKQLSDNLPDINTKIIYNDIELTVIDINPTKELVICEDENKEIFNISIGYFIEEFS